MDWYLYILIAAFVITMGVLAYFGETTMVSERESDHHTCTQMRQQGWEEEDIIDFMSDCNGYYFAPGEDWE